MLGILISVLSGVIGTVAKGGASKAIAGGLAGALLNGTGPLIDMFSTGVVNGAGPQVQALGYAVGQAVIGGLVGYVVTWLAPKNAEPKKA